MYCQNCGKEIDDTAVVCRHCGVPRRGTLQADDNGGFGWGLLGFCVPVAGLVLFLTWKDTKPKTAQSAGIGALVSVSLYIAFYILLFGLTLLGALLSYEMMP